MGLFEVSNLQELDNKYNNRCDEMAVAAIKNLK